MTHQKISTPARPTVTWPICWLLALAAPSGCSDGASDGPELESAALVGALAQPLRRQREAGRRLFEEETFAGNGRTCATCHGPETGTLSPEDAQRRYREDQTNQFLPLPIPVGSRFQTAGVSELNVMGNPVQEYIFTAEDGTTTRVSSPDPGRALITGQLSAGTGEQLNAFKISSLHGAPLTAPYFHDNSAQTLEEVAKHYAQFFAVVTDPDGPGPAEAQLVLTEQDQADIVAFLRLL